MTTSRLKDSFLLYTEQSELVNELTNTQAGELFKSLFNYVATGEIPKLDGITKMAFLSIRQDLDKNAEKYEAIVEKRKAAGAKGGRQKAENVASLANASFATIDSSKSSYNDNVNDNDHVNVHVNDNVLSLNVEKKISDSDREILENYIRKKKLATRNVRAYANKMIENGDHREIIEKFKQRQAVKMIPREERIKSELESITDKFSCAKVLRVYHDNLEETPEEFYEVMKKYNLETSHELEEYWYEYRKQKQSESVKNRSG